MAYANTTASIPVPGIRLKNLVASVAVIAMALAFHRVAPQNRKVLSDLFGWPAFSFTGQTFLFVAALGYTFLLAWFFLREREPGVSKSLRFWQLTAEFLRSPRSRFQKGLAKDDRVAVLATLLKALYGPLMSMALMTASMGFLTNFGAMLDAEPWRYGARAVFDEHGFWLAMQIIVVVDVAIFTVGYLVELPRFDNRIRSVDPTLLGWAAALVCYAPFNIVLGALLGPPGNDFPRFANSTLHYALNLVLLSLMATYAWASVALGFKASNLTHRGVVDRGPYRWVRHPAYACKNMAWWIGSVPIVSAAFDRSLFDGAQALASVVGWTLLYVLRAVTEEDHLRKVDEEYCHYASRVRHRFIPGVI